MNTVLLANDAREEARRSVQDKIANLSVDDLVNEFTNLVVGGKQVQATLDNCRNTILRYEAVVERFIKDNFDDPSEIDQDDLKKLADEFTIELTKDITVTFSVKYTGEFTVPIGFDIESIKEEDFNYSAEMTATFDDLEVDSEEVDLQDFEVEEN